MKDKMVMRYDSNTLRISGKRAISLLLLFLILIDLSIFLNIPVFRQIFGFIFLTFVPGALILQILKWDKLGLTESLVLSVGLSISFIMLTGILINILYPMLGLETPLSMASLVISMTTFVLILIVAGNVRGGITFSFKKNDLKLDVRDKATILIPLSFPILSIFGMHLMNSADKNTLLIVLLLLIPTYIIFISIWHNLISKRAYPIILFLCSISLVLLMGLRSNHIIGADTHLEYYIFQQTVHNELWQVLSKSTLDSCLSISILPASYQLFLGTDPELIFKILYPIIFSISPLIVYIISKKYIGNFGACLASLFFMSQSIFLGATVNPRTVVAILFFALSIMVLFHNDLTDLNKKILFIIFVISCIVSHYSTTYIFFLILLLDWISMQIIRKITSSELRGVLSEGSVDNPKEPGISAIGDNWLSFKPHLTIGIVTLFFIMLFLWYSQIVDAPFNSGLNFISNTIHQCQGFFVLETRSDSVASALGKGFENSDISKKIKFIFYWATIALIAIGVLMTLFRYRCKIAFVKEENDICFSALYQIMDVEFLVFSIICAFVLVVSVALPFVFKGYGMDRAYGQMMVLLSPFFVIGGMTIARFLRVRGRFLMVLIVLIPYFMCTTGTMDQLFGSYSEITLNSMGHAYDVFYIHDQETLAAKWLKDFAQTDIKIYTDFYTGSKLASQAEVLRSFYPEEFIETYRPLEEGYFYLGYCGVMKGKLLDSTDHWHNTTKYKDEFAKRELIYFNGGSKVLK